MRRLQRRQFYTRADKECVNGQWAMTRTEAYGLRAVIDSERSRSQRRPGDSPSRRAVERVIEIGRQAVEGDRELDPKERPRVPARPAAVCAIGPALPHYRVQFNRFKALAAIRVRPRRCRAVALRAGLAQ